MVIILALQAKVHVVLKSKGYSDAHSLTTKWNEILKMAVDTSHIHC